MPDFQVSGAMPGRSLPPFSQLQIDKEVEKQRAVLIRHQDGSIFSENIHHEADFEGFYKLVEGAPVHVKGYGSVAAGQERNFAEAPGERGCAENARIVEKYGGVFFGVFFVGYAAFTGVVAHPAQGQVVRFQQPERGAESKTDAHRNPFLLRFFGVIPLDAPAAAQYEQVVLFAEYIRTKRAADRRIGALALFFRVL